MTAFFDRDSRVWAVLGPTNTGKTHLAVERMLGHSSGMIGLPLRLLAREVYDRIVRLKGVGHVALVTGEERIVPSSARYFVATVEAMPLDRPFSFIAVDEIQLCGDPDRGYIFTDRLLRARGTGETMFLGSDTMRHMIRAMIPGIEIEKRERLSTLTYTGVKKITRLERRTAIVAFSQEEVYAIAELIRRHKGGAAVVMGGLSPRTRNAQVALYQSGDVDFLVATDAIGMGLNMDVDHVAFASMAKFDGRRHRMLRPDEIAQIAGRAGRFRSNGSFGETADCAPFDDEIIERVENHNFEPLNGLEWRSANLDYASPAKLIKSLEAPPPHQALKRSRGAIDEVAFTKLSTTQWVHDSVKNSAQVRRLWDLCQLPDFRKAAQDEHVHLIEGIAEHLLKKNGILPSDWLARRVNDLDRTDGDIEMLQQRLAAIRTWTYVANRSDWVADNKHWQGQTRVIEDRLSDTLHERLMQRFIDKRTSALLKGLKREDAMDVIVEENGQVSVEGHHVGRLVGLRFQADPIAQGLEERAVKNAAFQALRPELDKRLSTIALGGINDFVLSDTGIIIWQTEEIGRLIAKQPLLKPKATLTGGELGSEDVRKQAGDRLDSWLLEIVARDLAPLASLAAAAEGETLKGLARGIAFRVAEAGGVMERDELQSDLRQLSPEDRKALRSVGLRIGRANIYAPLLLKPRAARLHALFAFFTAGPEQGGVPFLPPLGVTSFTVTTPVTPKALAATGFRAFGARAVRLDIVDRIADALFDAAEKAKGPCIFPPNIVSLLGASNEDAESLVEALGWEKTEVTRPIIVAEPVVAEPEAVAEAVDGAVVVATEVMNDGSADVSETAADADVAAAVDLETPKPETPEPEAQEVVLEEAIVAEPVIALAEAQAISEPVMETVTLWRRKRAKPERAPGARFRGPPRSAAGAGNGASDATPTREARPNGSRRDAPRREGPRPDNNRADGQRPPRTFNKDGGNRPPRRDAENVARFSAAPPPPTTKIDPNNPFAVLAALKVMAPAPAAPIKAKVAGDEERKKRKRKRSKKPHEGMGTAVLDAVVADDAGAPESA
jgi:ATP-dependent RNA helicase SUPV3L1/SUV3